MTFTAEELVAFPNTMIELCVVSYDSPAAIPAKVAHSTHNKWSVVWGPVALYSDFYIIYSLMYVVRLEGSNTYAVVIRGTTMDSLTTWLNQDFKVGRQVPWSNWDNNAPRDAGISEGTRNGLQDLLSMRDKQCNNQSLEEFLATLSGSIVLVTGHSLGGTLTPPMACWINSLSRNKALGFRVMPYSFAGLTPGNKPFAQYVDILFEPRLRWRYHNSLDIAPYLWNNVQGAENIYRFRGMSCPEYVRLALYEITEGAPPYAQPGGDGHSLKGRFVEYDIFEWDREAAHQHSSLTYRALLGTGDYHHAIGRLVD